MSKNILITNDDGINSPGLAAAISAVSELGEIIIVAPSSQQTAMGRSLYGDKENFLQKTELTIDKKNYNAYHSNCSPALIVQHSINTIFANKLPDLIISGINYGENLGTNVTQSGTVGAALEGASYGIPAIAISLQTKIEQFKSYSDLNWDGAKHFLNFFSKKILDADIKEIEVLKIDIPFGTTKNTEWEITRQSKSSYYSSTIKKPTINSKIKDAELQIKYKKDLLEIDSDISTIINNKIVSVTPLSLDLTANLDLKLLKKKFEKQF